MFMAETWPQARASASPLLRLLYLPIDVEVAQLNLGNRRRCVGHQVHAFRGLRERDHVADVRGL